MIISMMIGMASGFAMGIVCTVAFTLWLGSLCDERIDHG